MAQHHQQRRQDKMASSMKANDDSNDDTKRFDTSALQFRQPAKASSKVVLDERFASVLTDERFQLQVQDKYGRKTKKKQSAKEELSAFYTVEDTKQTKDEDVEKEAKSRRRAAAANESKAVAGRGGDDSDDDQPGSASRIAYLTALSRGQVDVSSSSSEDDGSRDSDTSSSGEDDDSDDDADHQVEQDAGGVLDPFAGEEDVEITDEPTRFLAVTQMDWTNLRAIDIFALLSSFVPASAVRRVRVYVSDFGQEKLSNLERFGPSQVWKKSSMSEERDDDGSETGSGNESDGGSDSGVGAARPSAFDNAESDFDQEKLRAYEASKLRYYFAVAEFDSVDSAEKAYREVDGMEFEHSSAQVDLRAIAEADLESIVHDRPLRDEASTLPSNYLPPDFIVSALQQTNVACTWDLSDQDRERTLTKYGSGEHWRSIAESDDLKAYLASDVSSDEEEEGDKALLLRKTLGLDSDSDDMAPLHEGHNVNNSSSDSEDPVNEGEDGSDQESFDGEKEFTFVPGAKTSDLTEKIQEKLTKTLSNESEELTPWEKYKEKRKKKRQERRQTSRSKRIDTGKPDDDLDGEDKHDAPSNSKAALELLVAGEENDDSRVDYDMRELQRLEKNKGKNLKGSRKRKESQRADSAAGTGFDVDVSDKRFQAVLDGADHRFGIDQTDTNFKKTPGMVKILKEQTRRRKKQRTPANMMKPAAPNVSVESVGQSSGAKALSAIVQSLKAKHSS